MRDAATVILLRDGADGLEVWLQRRPSSMVFAADMHVFPGGAVEGGDAAVPIAEDALRGQCAVWGDDDEQRVAALLGAAVRETEEEAGVRLLPDTLVPWARWITPVGPPRRFDARFYLAPCPPDASPEAGEGEVADAGWVVVTAAVERFGSGELPMWPPTIANLVALVPHDDVASALAAAPGQITAVNG